MGKYHWFAEKGTRVLAESPTLRKLAADMKADRDRKEREKTERIEKLRASHAQAPLDLASKLSPRVREKLRGDE